MDQARSPLLASDSAAAGEVRRARALFRAGRQPDTEVLVRPVVLSSWARSREAGVNPDLEIAPTLPRMPERAAPGSATVRLANAARPVLRFLARALRDRPFLLTLTDESCVPLATLAPPAILRECERINLAPGSGWSEDQIGTDAAALSLLLGEPLQLHWYEHWAAIGDAWTGNAAPIHDPATGDSLGSVSLYGWGAIAHPDAFDLAVDAALMIEHRLRETDHAQQLLVLDRFAQHVSRTPGDAAICLSREGIVLALSPAACEVLRVAPERAKGIPLLRIPGIRSPSGPRPFSGIEAPCAVQLTQDARPLSAAVVPICRRSEVSGFLVQLERARGARRPPASEATAARAAAGDTGWRAVHRFADFVGESELVREMLSRAERAARTALPVLLCGETGTGKELLAHAIHAASDRAGGPFVIVNCGAVSDELLGAELFGHDEGAFTGALRGGRPGRLELADHGTLFLDEVEAMSPRMQAHLLRFLEDPHVVRVGSNRPRRVDVRVVAATNEDLREASLRRAFRRDLFHRLSVLVISLPALRDRPADIGPIARQLLAREGVPVGLSRLVVERLERHDWPGNVRELRNVLLQAALAARGACIEANDLPLPRVAAAPSGAATAPVAALAEAERRTLVEALRRNDGNLSRTAASLGIHRATLHRKLARHGIRAERQYR